MVDIWDEVKYEPNVWDEISYKPQEPVTLKGAAGSLASGYAGGAGGFLGDIQNLLTGGSPTHVPVGLNPHMLAETQNKPLLGTHQVTESVAQDLGIQQPQNALERILSNTGQFSGAGGVLGTALGGPVAGVIESGHGAVSGALYGGLKELGWSDPAALFTTAVFTVSPIAGQKFIQAWKSGRNIKKAMQEVDIPAPVKKQIIDNIPDDLPPPPPGGIGVATELPTGSPNIGIAEEAVSKLNEPIPSKLPSPVIQIESQLPAKEGGKSLVGRVTTNPELGEIVSKEKFHSDAQAGREISRDIQKNFESGKKEVKAAYKEAEGVTESHNDRYPELAYKNEQRIEELERIPKRDPGAELVYQDALALRNLIGTPDGLFQANARTVMKQADSFSSRVKYDAPYQGVKSLVKSMVKDMNEAVISSLRRSGKDADKVIKADQIYARFADTFYSDEIAPFLSKDAAKKAESLGKKTLTDQPTYRSVKQAVGSRKLTVVNKIDREIIDSRMSKYSETPKFGSKEKTGSQLVGSKQYNKDLSDLSELIGKEKTGEVDHFLRGKQEKDELLFLKKEKVEAAKQRSESSKLTEERVKSAKEEVPKTTKELEKSFNHPSGIRELRKKMTDKGLTKEYESLSKQKIEEIFKEGGYSGRKLTGQQIEKVIEKNHRVLNELIGEERVNILFKEAKIAGAKEISAARSQVIQDKIIKLGAKTAIVGAAGALGGPLAASIAGSLVGIAL